MSVEEKSDASTVRFAARLPIKMPGQTRPPAMSSAASAMPEGGQIGDA
jgi:hypothetical protein